MQNLSVAELASWLADPSREDPVLLDVREPWEFQTCRIPQSLLMPVREVPARLAELEGAREIVVICHHGARSLRVALFLQSRGHTRVYNLAGGVDAWARSVDPAMPVY
ncbi:MAG TPA: rhodanese-like domain-containing protein [Burkholderiales bacterium]|nr:rhodanese-like domain-containing protein [Burkholderiales bacterium]